METPYQEHAQLGHKTTWHSPNGIDRIETCTDCGQRFLHRALCPYPETMGAAFTDAERKILGLPLDKRKPTGGMVYRTASGKRVKMTGTMVTPSGARIKMWNQ
jgi:hypothetical protein